MLPHFGSVTDGNSLGGHLAQTIARLRAERSEAPFDDTDLPVVSGALVADSYTYGDRIGWSSISPNAARPRERFMEWFAPEHGLEIHCDRPKVLQLVLSASPESEKQPDTVTKVLLSWNVNGFEIRVWGTGGAPAQFAASFTKAFQTVIEDEHSLNDWQYTIPR